VLRYKNGGEGAITWAAGTPRRKNDCRSSYVALSGWTAAHKL